MRLFEAELGLKFESKVIEQNVSEEFTMGHLWAGVDGQPFDLKPK